MNERNLYGLAQTAFTELDYTPRVEVVTLLDQVLIQYSTSECSSGEHGTFVKLRWHPSDAELWFFKLYVARPRRRQGLGSRIVATCEKLGHLLGSSRVLLMSLREAKPFWRSLGFRPHPTLPRVLTKPLTHDGEEQAFSKYTPT
jgi:GNAT superfamily N-acetyltransferase